MSQNFWVVKIPTPYFGVEERWFPTEAEAQRELSEVREAFPLSTLESHVECEPTFTRSELADSLNNVLLNVLPSDVDGMWISLKVAWSCVLTDAVPTLELEGLRQVEEFRARGEVVTDADVAAMAFVWSDGPWWVLCEQSDMWTGEVD